MLLRKPKMKRQSRGPLEEILRLVQPRVWNGARSIICATAARSFAKAAVSLIMLGIIAVVAVLLARASAIQRFCRRRTRATLLWSRSFPYAASLERTDAVCKKIEDIMKNTPGVKYCTTVEGFSLLSQVQATYNAFFFVTLKPWASGKKRRNNITAIRAHLNTRTGANCPRQRLRLFAAVHSRRRHVRRVHLHFGRPLRQAGSFVSDAESGQVHGRRAQTP